MVGVRLAVSGTAMLSRSDAVLLGEAIQDDAGIVAGAGDVDGDGLDDFLVGAGGEDSGGSGAGAVYLLLGPDDGSVFYGGIDCDDEDASVYPGSGC